MVKQLACRPRLRGVTRRGCLSIVVLEGRSRDKEAKGEDVRSIAAIDITSRGRMTVSRKHPVEKESSLEKGREEVERLVMRSSAQALHYSGMHRESRPLDVSTRLAIEGY